MKIQFTNMPVVSKNLLAASVAIFMVGSSSSSFGVDGEQNVMLEEIVVTAQKRGEQVLSDVPISIAVLQGADIESSGARGVADILNQIGGVNLVEDEPGRSSISIRGASAGNNKLTGTSPVGFYLDELPFSFVNHAVLPDANAYDLDRVEVLRGPQGTLYGASSLNGVVRVLTKDADLEEFEFKTRTRFSSTESSEDNYSGDIAVNVPLVPGKLAIRGVASYADMGGFIRKATESDFNDSEVGSYRVKINATPTEKLDLEFGVSASRVDNNGPSLALDDMTTPFLGEQGDTRDYESYNFIVDYDFDSFAVTSATGYLELTESTAFDFLIAGTVPVSLDEELDAEILSQEVRFASQSEGPLQWTAGLYYRDVEQRFQQAVPAFFSFPLAFTDASEQFAFFGELSRTFLDEKIEVTGGIRYFEDTVTTTETSTLSGGTAGPLLGSVESDFDAVTWRTVVSYYPSDDLSLYGSIATGFRSGINQAPVSLVADPTLEAQVDADSLITYELGAKGSGLDGRLMYEGAVFYTDWEDAQLVTLTSLGTAAIVNAEPVTGFGLDGSVTARVSERFTVHGNVGWNDLTIDGNVLQQGAVLFPKGGRMNSSPKLTAGINGEYHFPVADADLEGRIMVGARYTSELLQREIINGIPSLSMSDDILLAYLRAGVESEKWSAMLFVENLTNEDGALDGASLSVPTQSRLRPRTIGLQLTFDY